MGTRSNLAAPPLRLTLPPALPLVLLAAVLGSSTIASAEPWTMTTSSDFNARAVMVGTGDVDVGRPLATDPSVVPADKVLETRLRLGGLVAWTRRSGFLRPLGFIRSVSLHVQGDLLSGPQWTDGHSTLMRHDPLEQRPTEVLKQVRLRRGFVQVDTTLGRIAAGRMVSTWGLGLLAQSGDADPYQFGIKRDGVIVDRVQFATAPLLTFDGARPSGVPLFISVAADRVVVDDLAIASNGDEAYNFIGAILYRGAKVHAGGYAVMRSQTNPKEGSDLRIDANAYDVYARWADSVGDWRIEAATEWLMLRGETTYFRTASNPDLLKILQFGGVARITATQGDLGLRLETGLASGDDRPFDDTLSNLKFSREYRVGLAMFHEGVRRTTAALAANLDDPRYLGQAPTGFDRAATGGSVTGAIYAMPTVRYELFGKRLTLLGAVLWAQAPAPMVDAYQSGLNGGDAIGPRGGKASTDLGLEVDVAAAWRQPFAKNFAVTVRGDLGNWMPGAAFDDAAGNSAAAVMVWMGRVELQGSW